MNKREKIKEVLQRLKERFKIKKWWEHVEYTPFEIMVAIILSQRCYYKIVINAMKDFKTHFKTPKDVVQNRDLLEDIVRKTGYRQNKINAISGLSRVILEIGSVETFLNSDPTIIRQKLISIKGIGEKTADVMLMALFKQQVFPVDVHILRIFKRLGIVSIQDDIYIAKNKVEKFIPTNDRAYFHAALVSYGQTICRANNPQCNVCILRDLCDYLKTGDSNNDC